MAQIIEIVKVENSIVTSSNGSEVTFGDSQGDTVILAAEDQEGDLDEVLGQTSHVIQIVTDYECVTCRRVFPSEDLLKDHLEVCREEDDDAQGLEMGEIADYNSDDDENVDDPEYDPLDTSPTGSEQSKNNNDNAVIMPVTDDKCHCCAEDLATCHQGGKYQCPNCELSFKKSTSLNRHAIVSHWTGEVRVCKECGATCPNKKSLDKHHYMAHATHQVFKCENCDKYFSRKYHLDRHVMQTGCNGETRSPHTCQVCQKEFTRKDNLRLHLRMHVGTNTRQKKACSYCSKEFYSTQQLVIHERTHTGERPVSCDLCSKTFLSVPSMKKHRRVHTGEKPFECKYCQKRFSARETLNRHHRTHTGEKPHVCQYCGKSFIQAAQLRSHVFHHTGENAFHCEICKKAFNRKTRLTMHMKFVHEGAVPFQCVICEKSFIRKDDLTRHLVLHSGLKPHKCEKCGKTFAVKSSLRTHMNTHRREPPQSCDECGRAFIRQDCLMRHMRSKHRDLLEDVMAEAEKRRLQEKFIDIASTAAAKTQSNDSNVIVLSQDELLKAIAELLTILIEEDTLQVFGWPTAPIQDVLEAVIKRCGHQPISSDSNLMFVQRLRENVKLLFTVVIEDDTVKSLLTTQTVDEVIMHVLKLSKNATLSKQ